MRRLTVSILFLMLFALLLSSGAATLNAQTSLQVIPAALTFNMPAGSSQTQVMTVTTTPVGPYAVTIPSVFQSYLSVTPLSGATTPAQVSVTANSTGLTPSDTPYNMLLIVGAGQLQQQVTVSIKVTGAASQIAASQTSLTFTYQTGGAAPDPKDITISSLTGTPLSFTVTAVSSGWLAATPQTGNTSSANVVRVTATPGSLVSGTYNGTVTVTPAGGNPLQIPVTFTVGGAPQISLNKTALSYVWQTGTPAPGTQSVSVTALNTDQQLFFNVDANTDNNLPWLVVTTNGSVTPAEVQVSISPSVLATLAPGKYIGRVRVLSGTAVNPIQTVTVTLTVSATPLLIISPATMQFTMAASGTVPAAQNINVGSTGTPISFGASYSAASGGNWLTLSPVLGTSPATVQVSVNSVAQTLLPGTYNATVTVGSGVDQQQVAVTLTVSNSAVLSSSPAALTFVYQTTKLLPGDQFFTVSSSGAPQGFTATATSTGNWLSLNTAPGTIITTPVAIGVKVNVTGLTPGTYSGTITLTPQGGNGGPISIPVTLQISNTPLLRIGSGELNFTFQPGAAQTATQNLAVESTGDPITYNVGTSINNGSNWLGIFGASIGTTPSNVNVAVNVTGLTPGTYTGAVTITPVGGGPAQSVPVKVTISAGVLAVSPATITFTQFAGGAAPATQTVTVTSTGGALPFSVSAQTDSAWLTVTPTSGTTTGTLTITADGKNLLPGIYNGTVTIQAPGASNSPQLVRVTLTVQQPQSITISTSALVFNAASPNAPPASQTVNVQGSGNGMTLKTTVTTATGGNWLTVVPTDASLPVTLTISIVPQTLASLAPGTYIGVVKVESPTSTNSPQTIQVTLNVAAALPGVLGVVNAASYLAGPVAPGELLYITGTNMGPAALSIAKPNPAYPTVLDDVRVLFDNVPAPLVYVMNDKIVAVVPWIMAGRLSTKMQVEYKSVRSAQLDLQIGTVAPGIFSIAASGSGQGAVLNQDYSVNGVAAGFKRAAKGSVLQVFGTGGGATTPAGLDGQITPGILYPLNVGLAAVTASVGGVPAKVTYAGGAPGLISGALQVNVELPADAPSGAAVPLVILVGGTPTQANITVAIE